MKRFKTPSDIAYGVGRIIGLAIQFGIGVVLGQILRGVLKAFGVF